MEDNQKLSVDDMRKIISLTDEREKLKQNINLLKMSLQKLSVNYRYTVTANLNFVAPLCYGSDDKHTMHVYVDEIIKKAIIESMENRIEYIDKELETYNYDKDTKN